MTKVSADTTATLATFEERIDDCKQKIQTDREFVDTRLSRIDDTAVMKKWVENNIQKVNFELEHKIDNDVSKLKETIK